MTDTLPKPNVELLDRTLAEVRRAARRKRLRWDQDWFRVRDECGTAMCFAGWAVTLGGRRWADEVDPLGADWEDVLALPDEDSYWTTDAGVPLVTAGDVAERLLGLTHAEAERLFRDTNTLRDLSRIVRQIKQRA